MDLDKKQRNYCFRYIQTFYCLVENFSSPLWLRRKRAGGVLAGPVPTPFVGAATADLDSLMWSMRINTKAVLRRSRAVARCNHDLMIDISTSIPLPGCSDLPSLFAVQAYLQPGGSKPLYRLVDSNQAVVATEIQDLHTARMLAAAHRLAKHVQGLCGDSRQHLLWGLDLSPDRKSVV